MVPSLEDAADVAGNKAVCNMLLDLFQQVGALPECLLVFPAVAAFSERVLDGPHIVRCNCMRESECVCTYTHACMHVCTTACLSRSQHVHV